MTTQLKSIVIIALAIITLLLSACLQNRSVDCYPKNRKHSRKQIYIPSKNDDAPRQQLPNL